MARSIYRHPIISFLSLGTVLMEAYIIPHVVSPPSHLLFVLTPCYFPFTHNNMVGALCLLSWSCMSQTANHSPVIHHLLLLPRGNEFHRLSLHRGMCFPGSFAVPVQVAILNQVADSWYLSVKRWNLILTRMCKPQWLLLMNRVVCKRILHGWEAQVIKRDSFVCFFSWVTILWEGMSLTSLKLLP